MTVNDIIYYWIGLIIFLIGLVWWAINTFLLLKGVPQ